jgi:sialate O-acetylesterase
MIRPRFAAFLFAFCLSVSSAHADVKLPRPLTDHMVLQRDQAVPLWGLASPGEKVSIKFRDQEKSATADKDGKWLVKLDPLKAGGPDKLTISGNNTITLNDVLVGEVWLGSGQSNMEGSVNGYARGDAGLAKLAEGTYPKLRLLTGGRWQEASPQTCKGFSAILFSFGVHLQKDLDIPVGLMVGAVGGTPSGYWLTEEMFRDDSACQDLVKKVSANYPYDQLLKKYQDDLVRWEKAAQEAKDAGKPAPKKPTPPSKAGQTTGGKIGHLYESHIRPLVPYGIRGVLWDQGESGTAITGIDQYTLMGGLIRGWRKDFNQGDFAFLYVQKPSGGGCAFDEGNPVTSKADKFAKLPARPAGTADGIYRETHIRIKDYPNTAMVTSSDLGPGIHPSNKSGYGERATRVALGLVYGKKVEIYGPVYDAYKIEDGKVRVTFKHVGQGLAFKHGDKLQGFAVAGEDKVYHWADATIDGDTVVVSCDKVKTPAAVRYAWGSSHPWANLFNKDGLPGLPFRTDSWEK